MSVRNEISMNYLVCKYAKCGDNRIQTELVEQPQFRFYENLKKENTYKNYNSIHCKVER